MSDLTNKTIGQYYIEKLLGQGGMGSVYRARDVQLQRQVAFKMMHAEIAAHDELRRRFLQEARAIAALDHPHIIRIFSFHADEDLYLVMEYVPGGSLRDYVRKLQAENKMMELPEAIALIKQLASALHYAHGHGMIHRDVKPDNVLLKLASSPGMGDIRFTALLTDFGLAKLADNAVVQTIGHNPMGTLPYMSLEQIRNENIDNRTDLYALGIMMFELILGDLPFKPRNVVEAAQMHGYEQPPRPSVVRTGLSSELEKIMLKAIAKSPRDRFQNGQELIDALDGMEKAARARPNFNPSDNIATYIDPKAVDRQRNVSLGNYLNSLPDMTPKAPDISIPVAPTNLQSDQIVIMQKGQEPRYIPITQQSLMMGRDPAHPIVLDAEKISRNHARIDKQPDGSYTITDLGSTNGTYLDEAKLLSNVPEKWLEDKVVVIGGFRLSIQRAQVYATQRPVQGVLSAADASPVHGLTEPSKIVSSEPNTRESVKMIGVGVQVNPSAVSVDPGMQIGANVEIFNQSDIVEHYRIQIQGIPNEWFTVPPNTLQLLPGNRGSIPVAFHPPRTPKSTAGTHTFGIRVASQERGDEIGRGTGLLTVKPYYQYTVDMEPKRIRRRGMVRFLISNQSNAPDSYRVAGRDREEGLNFFPPSTTGTVGAGLTEVIQFEVRPKRGNFIGSTKNYSFELMAEAASGRAQMQNGELVHNPVLPIWLLSLLMLLCLLCLALLAFLYFNQPKDEVVNNDNIITQTNDEIRQLLTATADQFATREVNRAATATAVALLDDDNDGLTNAEEAKLGTDPNLDDTDGDGLKDGEEINRYETDPKNDDTDNDGLDDGEEVNRYRTDPKNDDTDGDGLKDGEEVLRYNSEPDQPDTDGDGLKDGVEVNERGTFPDKFDSDGDGVNDFIDAAPLDPNRQ